MKRKDLIAGKHWVETRNGDIGCVMEGGIVFKEDSWGIHSYSEDLISYFHSGDEQDIIRILEPKFQGTCGNFTTKSNSDIIAEINQLKSITSLDILEEVRLELCELYYGDIYITNEYEELWMLEKR